MMSDERISVTLELRSRELREVTALLATWLKEAHERNAMLAGLIEQQSSSIRHAQHIKSRIDQIATHLNLPDGCSCDDVVAAVMLATESGDEDE